MNIARIKWLAIVSPAALVALFEYVRHQPFVLVILPMSATNWMTAVGALVVSYAYFRMVFALLERAQALVQKKQRELAVLEERDRIARDLHDGISQTLFFANVKLMEAEKHLQEGKPDLCSASLAEGRDAIRSSHDDVRQTIFNLKTVNDPTVDFATALREYVDEFQRQTEIEVHLDTHALDRLRLGPDGVPNLLLIIQEALWNVRKHARANSAEISFLSAGDGVQVRIRDDGRGFSSPVVQDGHRFGLKIMKERATLLGAELEVRAAPGRGTEVLMHLPAVMQYNRMPEGATPAPVGVSPAPGGAQPERVSC